MNGLHVFNVCIPRSCASSTRNLITSSRALLTLCLAPPGSRWSGLLHFLKLLRPRKEIEKFRFLEMSQKRQPDKGKEVADDGDDRSEKRQRVPCLKSVIIEATKHQAIQKFLSALEPLLRRVVKEEVELALAAHLGCKKRHCGKQVHPSTSRSFQLQFTNKLSLPIFTGSKIEGEDSVINIALVDALTDEKVTSGPLSSIKVEIVVLEGDFEGGEDGNWTSEDFNNNIVKEREGKRPLLAGDVFLNLNEGIGVVGDILFTDNSSWTRSRKFRLAARAVDGNVDGVRVIEAKSEAFMVKDHRGELYKKHYPPSMRDEVWRLEKIGKDGAFHKRLNSQNIYTVQDFLTLLWIDAQKLRNILGTGMSAKMWEVTAEHARTCIPDGQLYVYHPDDQRRLGVIFNIVGQIVGLLTEQFVPVNELSETQKENAHKMVKSAFDHWDDVHPCDNGALTSISLHAPSATSFLPDSPAVENPHTMFSSSQHLKPGGYSFIPPASSPDMVSSMLSITGARHFDDYTQQAIDSLGLRSAVEPLSFAGQDFCKDSRMAFCRVANSAVIDMESMSPSFCTEDQLQYFDTDATPASTTSQQPQHPFSNSGPQAELVNTRGAVLGKSARPCKAYSTWTMLIGVLKWRFSIRRIVASKKKSRVWESDEFG